MTLISCCGTPVLEWQQTCYSTGHVNEYPTMHYYGNPSHAQSMIAYTILTECFWNSSETLHCGNVVNMPYLLYWQTNIKRWTSDNIYRLVIPDWWQLFGWPIMPIVSRITIPYQLLSFIFPSLLTLLRAIFFIQNKTTGCSSRCKNT